MVARMNSNLKNPKNPKKSPCKSLKKIPYLQEFEEESLLEEFEEESEP